MYLKAVELQGFKSFPDKTRLTFENDITAIVGPNGSGKSNISDAIRWVMGEQRTKQLRGEKMEDVIFGGTEKRGKLGYAQVSLIFDNSTRFFNLDASEVVITRSYYRSGESEYAINHEHVRLKDVNELLMDTGLGRDGYSNIGQGRIAEIVSGNGKQRREVLEEAAGISRYRYRKEEAERKLARTQENLVRINDRIAELELQVGPLKKQAEVAQKCLGYRNELKGLEVSVWMNTLDKLREQAEAVNNDFEMANRSLAATREELGGLYASSEAIAQQMQDKSLETERKRIHLSEMEGELSEMESSAAVLGANLTNAMEGIARMEAELLQQDERAEALNRQMADHDARLAEIGRQLEENRSQADAVMERFTVNAEISGAAREEYGKLVEQESAQSAELTQCLTSSVMLAERLQESRQRQMHLNTAMMETEDKLSQIRNKLQEANAQKQEAKQKTKQLHRLVEEKRADADRLAKQLEALQGKRTQLESDAKVADSRISLLEDMEKEHEGYNRAVKFVLKEYDKGTLKGVRGAVGELITAEDAYAIAIETALGAAAQNIVVETQEDGARAIELLKRKDMGRCTFLPMNVIVGSEPGYIPERDKGFVGVASSLVTCDADYRGIVSNLLGRTIVVRTMADAIRISCRRENRLRIVTLDGQMINAGGSMTGGSLAKNTGILSRANELKRLKKRRGELETSLSDVLHEIEECKHRAEQGAIAWETAVNGLEAAEETLRTKENDVQRSEMLLDSVQHTADGFASDLEEVKQQIDDCRARIKQTNEQASEIQLKLDETRALISGMTAGQNEYERIRQSLSDELAEIKAQEAALRTEYSAVERAKEQVREMLGSVDLDKQAKTEEIGSAMDDVEMLRIALADGRNTIAKTAQAVADLKEEISNLIQTRLELERERNLTDKQAQDCNHQLLEMERLCSRFEQKKLTADLEEKQIIDRLWDNYGLVHSEAVKMRQPIENASAASRRIGELHKAISALGTPNFGAIDEYARVSERYEFLAGQRDDVEKSKKEILDIIGDVTAQMKEVFNEQFKLINECFRETFLELFGGGKAALVLEDENDVLECGIEIKVQPPGKALSSINLLSGGEMAFVAIALYFAIIKVRPTPFCVMDEIEAALDEANVIRFAEYLRSMCSNTQFIVITHRRGTMEAANRLYGVTMQEKGISRIIELDVAEAELRIAAEEG